MYSNIFSNIRFYPNKSKQMSQIDNPWNLKIVVKIGLLLFTSKTGPQKMPRFWVSTLPKKNTRAT